MITHEGLDRNFRFMVLEIQRQLESLQKLIQHPSEELLRNIISRDGYIDNLKSLIERKCMSIFRHTETMDEQTAHLVSAVNVMAINLERIGDFTVNVAIRVPQLARPSILTQYEYHKYFETLSRVIPLVVGALMARDRELGLTLCRAESELDDLYRDNYRSIREALRTGEETDDLLICLYIFHYFERMGDSLLNIGEAVLFSATGEKLKLHEYLRLREVLKNQQPDSDMSDFSLDFAWETRSGSRIAKVEEIGDGDNGGDLEAIFKKGQLAKLRRERDNILMWQEVMPGLGPRIMEFREDEDQGVLLLEYIDGLTFRDVLINAERPIVREALHLLVSALRTVWKTTRQAKPAQAKFLKQLRARLEDVFSVHPKFRDARHEIGSLRMGSVEELIERAQQVEKQLAAPFTVLTHGDFNNDNIIYDHRSERIHFIDLNRSRYSDYVQDVSIFLASNFRMPVFSPDLRQVINAVALRFYKAARSFARESGDETFEIRLALGLARALLTSTRFELDPEFAKVQYMRSVYLLEKVIRHPPLPLNTFTLAREVLMY